MAQQARVSRVTFKKIFGGIEQAFVALVEQVTGWPAKLVSDAFERESSWRASVLAGLEALLVFLDSEPALARVCLVVLSLAMVAIISPLVHRPRWLHLRTLAAPEHRSRAPLPRSRKRQAEFFPTVSDSLKRTLAGDLRSEKGSLPPLIPSTAKCHGNGKITRGGWFCARRSRWHTRSPWGAGWLTRDLGPGLRARSGAASESIT